MAEELGLSPSYLNLMERNQRPITAQVLIRLSHAYALDPAGIRDGRSRAHRHGARRGLRRPALSQHAGAAPRAARDGGEPRPASWTPSPVSTAPTRPCAARGRCARPISTTGTGPRARSTIRSIACGTTFRKPRTIFRSSTRPPKPWRPSCRSRATTSSSQSAERLRDEARHPRPHHADRRHAGHPAPLRSPSPSIADLGDRRFVRPNLPGRLSTRLRRNAAGRSTLWRSRLEPEDGPARRLLRISLATISPGRVIMPYGRFHAAAEALRYDVDVLGARFGASFEQVAHRLTTLARPGARGVPFFLVRVDSAGNVSKRFSSGRFPFSQYGGTCPLWNVHATFRTPAQVVTQIVELPDNSRWFSSRAGGQAGLQPVGHARSAIRRRPRLRAEIRRPPGLCARLRSRGSRPDADRHQLPPVRDGSPARNARRRP